MQIEIKAGDAVRVTGQATIMGADALLLWVNNRPVGPHHRRTSGRIARGGQGPFLHSVTLKGARRMIWIVALIAFVAGFAARDQMWRLWP